MNLQMQSLVAAIGLTMVGLGFILVMLKNKLQNKKRFTFGITLLVLGGASIIFFLQRTPDFDEGFNAMILMGLFGMFYFYLYTGNQYKCNKTEHNIYSTKEQKKLLSKKEEKAYIWAIAKCHLVTVFLYMFLIGSIGRFIRLQIGS